MLSDNVVAALQVNQDYLALGSEIVEREGGRFVRNTRLASVWDTNHVDTVTARTSDEIERLMATARVAYAHTKMLRFDVDSRTPSEFEAYLQLADFERHDMLVMLLEGEPLGRPQPFEIRPVTTLSDWEAFRQLKMLDAGEYSTEVRDQLFASDRGRTPPARPWLGYIDGTARGYLSSWEGRQGTGQVESLYVDPAYRKRGLASALLHHSIRDCRVHGAKNVCLVAMPGDTPKHIYAAMGFRPVAIKREYRKPMP